MALLPIAVLGCTLTVSNASGQAVMTPLVSLPSTTTLAENKFVYSGNKNVTVTACSDGSYVQADPSFGDLEITATKVKVDNDFVLRVLDKTQDISVTVIEPGTPPKSKVITVTVTITDAGQTKVLAN